MTYVQSFSAVTPPPRYDAIAWAELEIYEAELEDGPFGLIDTQAIDVDATPESPNTIEITTTLAEFAVGWYRFRFKDAVPNYSNYTAAVLAPAGADGTAYFTVAEMRARFAGGDEDDLAGYSDGQIQAVIDDAVQAYEHEAGLAFVPREATATVRELVDTRTIRLPRRPVRSITSATGATTGEIDIGDARIKGRLVTLPDGWPAGEDIEVVYEHGRDRPRQRTIRAVQLLARTWLIEGPIDERATQIAAAGGGVINLSTPGMFGAVFGIPEVDGTLERDRDKAYVI